MVITTNTHAMAPASNSSTSESMPAKSPARLSPGPKTVNSTAAKAAAALTAVRAAIIQLAADRAALGAVQSRMNFTAEQLTVSRENLSAASARIQGVDGTKASTRLARYNVLGLAMLAPASQRPQSAPRVVP